MDLTQPETSPGIDLGASIPPRERTEDTEPVLVTDAVYETESTGHVIETPVVHLRCRNGDGLLRWVEVEGFRPYFGILQEDFLEHTEDIATDRRVLGVEVDCSPEVWEDHLEDQYLSEDPDEIASTLSAALDTTIVHAVKPFTTISDDPLAKIIVRVPGDVAGQYGMRDNLHEKDIETLEADIPFVHRFLISTEIYRGVEIPVGTTRVRYENWQGESDGAGVTQDIKPCDPPDVEPRMVAYDIEVATMGDGFPQADRARKPITAVSAYDSYDDEYRLWGLVSWEWGVFDPDSILEDLRNKPGFPDDLENDDPRLTGVEVHSDETDMLESFHEWVLEREPDIFTGWNTNGFDNPYLIQRSYNTNARRIKEYTRCGNPGTWVNTYKGNRSVDFSLKGICTLDLFSAYKKTQFRELSSYSLGDVAEAELGYGKVDFAGDELDDAWHYEPVEFYAYSVRDTQAVADIEEESGLINLYDNMREVTGALYETCDNNGPMLDMLFLRRAYEQGYMLPTNTEPDEGIYHGAKVFETVPGIHLNAVYPDLSSLYPNLFAMLNLGSETIIGNEEALEESEYTEDDCFKFPVDNRPFAVVPKGESYDHVDREKYKGVKTPSGAPRAMFDPVIEWEYVLKPDVKESFIRSTVDELIELKYLYSGDLYSAIKRVTNSVYGVMGDSSSGGVGFRLYDRKVAEGITLAGRLVITHTAEEFTEYLNEHYDPEAQLIGGDTDSSVTSIPSAPDMGTALSWAQEAVEHVDDSYDEFSQEVFNFGEEDEHRLAVELESLASALFFLSGGEEKQYRMNEDGWLVGVTEQESIKKRYAQAVVWDDDDGWLDTPDGDEYPGEDVLADDADLSRLKYKETLTLEEFDEGGLFEGMDPQDVISITGMEYVRSDTAQVTKDAQLKILMYLLLTETPKEKISEYLRDLIDRVENGDVPLEDLARPQGISNHLDEYGWKDIEDLSDDEITDDVLANGGKYVQKAGPTYRGAKYANANFSWEEIDPGTKPVQIPIATVRSDEYPPVYDYGDMYPADDRGRPLELDEPVDVVAVENPDRLPDGFEVDTDKIIEKRIREKTEPILNTVDLDFDDLTTAGHQTGLSAFA